MGLKKHFMAPFHGWGSTASRLEPLRGGCLLFTTKFPEVSGTHFVDLGEDERLSRPWSHPVVLNTGPLDWESSALTTWPLLHQQPEMLQNLFLLDDKLSSTKIY